MTRGRHSAPQHFIMSTALLSRARIGGANNGTRYRTHLVAGLQDTNTGEMIMEVEPEVVEQVEDTNGAFETIRQGMIGVAEYTNAFIGYPITIAASFCPTGIL